MRRLIMKHAAALLAAGALSVATAPTAEAQQRSFLPPTMGWSSWNTFALNISEEVICGQADQMVAKGLDKVGYKYINIDDGYWDGRGSDGNLIVNTKLFPNGMKHVADYIHSLGLKAGIYSDAGDNTCGSIYSASGDKKAYGLNVGLAGHELQDSRLYFGEWGYDFIKVDFCGGNNLGLDERKQYTKISEAIRRCEKETGRKIVFNVCRWAYPGTWIGDVSDSWRTTGDIIDSWHRPDDLPWANGVKEIVLENLYIQAYTGGGHYNDMDMLEIGRLGDAAAERTHMAYWCIASSPLLIGCDMSTLNDETLALLKNTDLIAMNQDVLGIGAPVVQREGDVYVVAKDMEKLHGPKRAVVVMNLTDRQQTIAVDLKALQYQGAVSVHDCFSKADTRESGSTMTVTIPAHGSQAYILSGTRCDKTLYQAEEAWLHDYQEISEKKTAMPMMNAAADQGVYVGNIGWRDSNYLEWRDVHVDKAGKYRLSFRYASAKDRDMTVSVNGRAAKNFTGLNSGSWDAQWSVCTVDVDLKAGTNTVSIANADDYAPNIDSMSVERL